MFSSPAEKDRGTHLEHTQTHLCNRFTLIQLHNTTPPLTIATVHKSLPSLPSVTVTYPTTTNQRPFNDSKLAFLVENRPLPMLAPLLLHFMAVVPPDWRFRFMGSQESVRAVRASKAIRHQVEAGKLDVGFIPRNMSTGGQEEISRFLTTLWLYETVLRPAEWVLVFQSDSEFSSSSSSSFLLRFHD